MRVLIVIGSLEIGGAERHLLQVLPRLRARGVDMRVYTLSHRGELAAGMEAQGVPVMAPPFAAALRPLPWIVRWPVLAVLSSITLLSLFFFGKHRIVHFFLPESYLMGGTLSPLIPRLRRVMSRRSLNHYQRRFPLLARWERMLHANMDAVLGNSLAVTNQLIEEGVKPERTGLIYNGVDPAPFDADFDRSAVRQALDIPECALVMTLVANLIAYKGHADLLDALGHVGDRMPGPWVVLCVGRDDGIGAKLGARARELGIDGHVRWLGVRDDVVNILRASDVGLSCSHEEGFSNAVLEGMAAGLPMVVTDVGGNGEAVIDGVTGRVVPAHTPRDLGEAIVSLATDTVSRQRMGAAGARRVAERFTIDSCVKRYQRFYDGMLSDKQQSVSAMIAGPEIGGAR